MDRCRTAEYLGCDTWKDSRGGTGPSLAVPPTTSLLWSPTAYESGAFLLPDTGWPWGVVLCLPNSLAWYERLMNFLQESVRASSSYTNTAPNSCIFVASPGRALATPTIFILTTKAPGLDSIKQGRCGPAWHGCTEDPANMSSYKLPGLGGIWAQKGWMFLKATKPLSATTPTVLPPLSRYLSPLLLPPLQTSQLSFAGFSSCLEDVASGAASSCSLCHAGVAWREGKSLTLKMLSTKEEIKPCCLGLVGCLLTSSPLPCTVHTKQVQQAWEISSAPEHYTDFNLQDKSQLHYLYL